MSGGNGIQSAANTTRNQFDGFIDRTIRESHMALNKGEGCELLYRRPGKNGQGASLCFTQKAASWWDRRQNRKQTRQELANLINESFGDDFASVRRWGLFEESIGHRLLRDCAPQGLFSVTKVDEQALKKIARSVHALRQTIEGDERKVKKEDRSLTVRTYKDNLKTYVLSPDNLKMIYSLAQGPKQHRPTRSSSTGGGQLSSTAPLTVEYDAAGRMSPLLPHVHSLSDSESLTDHTIEPTPTGSPDIVPTTNSDQSEHLTTSPVLEVIKEDDNDEATPAPAIPSTKGEHEDAAVEASADELDPDGWITKGGGDTKPTTVSPRLLKDELPLSEPVSTPDSPEAESTPSTETLAPTDAAPSVSSAKAEHEDEQEQNVSVTANRAQLKNQHPPYLYRRRSVTGGTNKTQGVDPTNGNTQMFEERFLQAALNSNVDDPASPPDSPKAESMLSTEPLAPTDAASPVSSAKAEHEDAVERDVAETANSAQATAETYTGEVEPSDVWVVKGGGETRPPSPDSLEAKKRSFFLAHRKYEKAIIDAEVDCDLRARVYKEYYAERLTKNEMLKTFADRHAEHQKTFIKTAHTLMNDCEFGKDVTKGPNYKSFLTAYNKMKRFAGEIKKQQDTIVATHYDPKYSEKSEAEQEAIDAKQAPALFQLYCLQDISNAVNDDLLRFQNVKRKTKTMSALSQPHGVSSSHSGSLTDDIDETPSVSSTRLAPTVGAPGSLRADHGRSGSVDEFDAHAPPWVKRRNRVEKKKRERDEEAERQQQRNAQLSSQPKKWDEYDDENDSSDFLSLLRDAVKQGDAKALYNMAGRFKNNSYYGRYVTHFARAARRGDANAQYELAIIYRDQRNKTDKDDLECARWLVRAAHQGDRNALDELETVKKSGPEDLQYAIGKVYEEGRPHISQNKEEALAWHERAATHGHDGADEARAALDNGRVPLAQSQYQYQSNLERPYWWSLVLIRVEDAIEGVRLADKLARNEASSALEIEYRRSDLKGLKTQNPSAKLIKAQTELSATLLQLLDKYGKTGAFDEKLLKSVGSLREAYSNLCTDFSKFKSEMNQLLEKDTAASKQRTAGKDYEKSDILSDAVRDTLNRVSTEMADIGEGLDTLWRTSHFTIDSLHHFTEYAMRKKVGNDIGGREPADLVINDLEYDGLFPLAEEAFL